MLIQKIFPGLKRRALSQSLPALLFRTLRTLADSRTKNAKYHGSNLNYKFDKKNRWYLCGRCSTLGRMLLFCVAGAGLWKYDGCVAWPCHATIHQGPSPKMCLILKRARSHICFIQETNWSTVQYNHVTLSAPFCSIYHSPATGEGSSGVATFLPHPLTASSHSIIPPGYLLTISTSIGGLSVELINVYLHPRKISQSGSSLLAHLRSEHSRSHDLRFIGGDLNQINTKVPNLYQQIIMELNCIPAPTLPTYRLPNGYTSPLDAFLLQYRDYLSSSPPKFLTFWPSFQPRHGILICKFTRTSSVKPCPDDLPAPHIPSSVFYTPPSQQDSPPSSATPFLSHLHRSLLCLPTPTTTAVKSTIWAWWHFYGKQPHLTPTPAHHFHILSRKLTSAKTRNVTVPLPSLNWLLSHFPSDPYQFPIHHDAHATLPAPLLSDLLIK